MRQIDSQFSRQFRVIDVLVHSVMDKFETAKNTRFT